MFNGINKYINNFVLFIFGSRTHLQASNKKSIFLTSELIFYNSECGFTFISTIYICCLGISGFKDIVSYSAIFLALQ